MTTPALVRPMHLDLSGRTAIVTGAGRGIGAEIAATFARSGADVVTAARTEPEIEATADRARDHGVEAMAVPTDLADAADVDGLVDRTVDRFGAPDVLVNDAAAHVAGDPLDRTAEELDAMVDVNFRGLFLLSQRFASERVASSRTGGRIINVSSIVGELGVRGMPVYSGTKAGVHGLTRGLAAELSQYGITVNSVSPGLTRVPRIERLLEEKPELYEREGIPLDRLGEPDDVAAACTFLASEQASYVTGIDLPVDGGVKMTAALYPYD